MPLLAQALCALLVASPAGPAQGTVQQPSDPGGTSRSMHKKARKGSAPAPEPGPERKAERGRKAKKPPEPPAAEPKPR